MSTSFSQEFIVHPVGQGLFYSGKVSLNNQVDFRMVFDCGSNGSSTAAGKEEVVLYRQDPDYVDNKILDLLIISHFDEDHVNHIGKLLDGEIKVKRLVMPMISFSERLFLVLKYLDNNKQYTFDDDDFFLRFNIDPIGALANNLDGDSEIIFIEGEPNDPIAPDKEIQNNEESKADSNQGRLLFDFEDSAKKSIETTEKSAGKQFKVSHIHKATVKSVNQIPVMDFLFYKRSIGKSEIAFYEVVQSLFFAEYKIDKTLQGQNLHDRIVEVVKGIKSGTRLREIFVEAKKTIGLKSNSELKIEDLNTTALCLLHRNLIGLLSIAGITREQWENYSFRFNRGEITSIAKFISNKPSRVERTYHGYYRHWNFINRMDNLFIYPNVMLTSDSFLLTTTQVEEFLNHYTNYWNCFWLFQIPHHGSDKSSNKLLHTNIPHEAMNFINYGVDNRHKHPSASTVHDLVATGQSINMIPINEYNGLRFSFRILPRCP